MCKHTHRISQGLWTLLYTLTDYFSNTSTNFWYQHSNHSLKESLLPVAGFVKTDNHGILPSLGPLCKPSQWSNAARTWQMGAIYLLLCSCCKDSGSFLAHLLWDLMVQISWDLVLCVTFSIFLFFSFVKLDVGFSPVTDLEKLRLRIPRPRQGDPK